MMRYMSKALIGCLSFAFLVGTFSAAQTTTAGPSPAQLYQRGMNALTGSGVTRNELNATSDIRRAADLGYAPAQVVLGYFLETGTILTRETQEAAVWYKKAAEQDDVLGEQLLGSVIFSHP